ncbi:hypothetical protein HZB01_03780 [Candidatus Woesearchaeota archaeon]|nr:hypothetical protein [Candidatus Woesearchaeota archaeon]
MAHNWKLKEAFLKVKRDMQRKEMDILKLKVKQKALEVRFDTLAKRGPVVQVRNDESEQVIAELRREIASLKQDVKRLKRR